MENFTHAINDLEAALRIDPNDADAAQFLKHAQQGQRMRGTRGR